MEAVLEAKISLIPSVYVDVTRGLILHIEGETTQPSWHGFVLAATMLAASWCQTIFYHQHYHLAMTCGMRMKTALTAAIYKKVFLAVYLLWNTLGMPVLSGLGLLMMLVPLNAVIAYFQQRLQRQNLYWKDRRIKVMNEVLGGIKVLKLYAWEESFQQKILSIRRREVNVLSKLAWLNAVSTSIFIWTCAPYLACHASFATFTIMNLGSVLTADMAFVTLALFNILQFPISFIPEMVSFTTQASVSMRRIGRYLCETELERTHYHKRDLSD